MKKQRLKNYLKFGILLFGISFLITNCEKVENTDEFNLNENKSYKVISLNEISKNKPKVADIIENLKSKGSSSNIMNRGGETYLGIDHVLTDKVIQITDGNNVSTFTFGIDTDFQNTGYIENLHLIEVDNNHIGYIMRYEPSTDWILDPNNYTPKGDLVLNLLTFSGNITKYSLKGELIWTTEPTELERVWVETCAFSVVEYCSNTYEDNPDGTAHIRGASCEGPFSNQTELVCTMVFLGGGPVIGNGPGGTGNPDDDGGNFHDSVGGSGDGYDNNCEQVTGTLINDALPLDGIASGCTTNTDTGVNQPLFGIKRECKKIERFIGNIDTTYMSKVRNLKNLDNLAFETAVTMSVDGTIGEYQGTADNVGVPENPASDYTSISHVHNELDKPTYSVYSLSDLAKMANIYRAGYIRSSKFVAFLATADNTYYALTIRNLTKFAEFFNYLKIRDLSISDEEREIIADEYVELYPLLEEYYLHKTDALIQEKQNPTLSLKLFMEFLGKADMGVTVFETDENFESFSELSITDQGIVERADPCEF